jgi:hypothetical protein
MVRAIPQFHTEWAENQFVNVSSPFVTTLGLIFIVVVPFQLGIEILFLYISMPFLKWI